MASVDDCLLLQLPEFTDERGSLSFAEGGKHVPFQFARTYYLYDMPPGVKRGAHAHKQIHQLVIAVAGSFDILLDDGRRKRRIHLSKPSQGLQLCPMIWRDLDNFSPDAVCLVLASGEYDEGEYFRSYQDFIEALQ